MPTVRAAPEDAFYQGMSDVSPGDGSTHTWIEDFTDIKFGDNVFCYKRLFPSSVTTTSLIEQIKIAYPTAVVLLSDIYNATGGFHKLFKRFYSKWTLRELNSIQCRPRRGMPSSKKIIGKCIKIMEKIPIKGFDQSPIDRCRYVAIDICV